jgi:uncharacterized repeat protein (TIGR01451 family)
MGTFMKQKRPLVSPQFMDSVFTPFSLVLISIVAIIAVAVALFQVNRGPVAPTAPQSQPQAAEMTSNTCLLTFSVAGPTATPGPDEIDLELQKTVNNSSPTVGQQIVFTVDVFNRGPDTATGVQVRDVLPTGLQYVSDNSGGAYNSTTGIWTIGSLNANQTVSIQITATVQAAGPLTNYAQVSAANEDDTDSTPDNGPQVDEDDDDSVTINSNDPTVDLELTKRVNNATPQVGSSIVFTIEVTNKGPADATNVTVSDVLPAGLTYLSDNSNGAFNSATGVWTIGNLPADQTRTLSLTVRVDSATPTTNYAEVETSSPTDSDSTPGNGPQPDDEDDDDSVTVTPPVVATTAPTNTPGLSGTPVPTNTPAPSADLRLNKRVSNSTPRVGDEITYTIEVYNAGPNNATGVTVREPLAGGLTFISATASQGSYNVSTGIWTIGTINVNETKTLDIRARVNVSGAISNIAQVQTSDQPDPNSDPGNNDPNEDDQDTATINPEQQGADLSLTKRVNNSRPSVGQNVVFTVQVHNAGPRQADNVTVKDLIPAGTTFVAANPSQGSFNSGNGIWTIGSLTKDSTVTMELTLRVDSASTIINIAEVQTSNQPDPDSTPGNNNPNEDDQDDAILNPASPVLPRSGNSSRTTLFVIATGVIVLIIGAMGLLLLL